MAKPLTSQSVAFRRARQERAQAEALGEFDAQAERKRERTRKLRKLRIENDAAAAAHFKKWRDRHSSSGE
ncbi:hypothetical protein [Hyphococcus luteus]|uniref:DUF4169 domain-containing protein n=1 Tax=Hyphococcus luteus TaxID=2058213 RepID=A0A2S7K7Q3_9PROT|nr:hypothetical protein [Marinicaulis flavus]PQA88499.1 hypothetical protein CW354_09430 [Marinicaulis flavus]